MRRTPRLVFAPLALVVALVALVALAAPTVVDSRLVGNPQRVTVIGTDGGVGYGSVVPCDLRAFSHYNTMVSTGPTVNATLSVPAGSCLRYQCNVATYALGTGTVNSDGGPAASIPTCLSHDGGAVFGCDVIAANQRTWVQLAPSENIISQASVSGTNACTISLATY